ncbi:MAG: universal stress protein [Caldilineaceae bacterium]
MTLAQEKVGGHLLIAISNTASALDLVRRVADQLAEPEKVHITLMHYMLPINWEHGGGDSPAEIAQRLRTEERARQNELYEERVEERYFDKARAILEEVGVPASQIKTSEHWDSMDAAHAILDELQQGAYSTVVVGEHHHNLLESLFSTSVADFLESHTRGVKLWAIPLPT